VPKLKSSKKRLITNLKAQARNKGIRTRMRSAIKKVRTAEDKSTAEASLSQAISIVDSTVRKGKLHRNTAARYKSRLSHFVQNMD
jgi:small subunit ribosomal protein S20